MGHRYSLSVLEAPEAGIKIVSHEEDGFWWRSVRGRLRFFNVYSSCPLNNCEWCSGQRRVKPAWVYEFANGVGGYLDLCQVCRAKNTKLENVFFEAKEVQTLINRVTKETKKWQKSQALGN